MTHNNSKSVGPMRLEPASPMGFSARRGCEAQNPIESTRNDRVIPLSLKERPVILQSQLAFKSESQK